MNIDGNDLVAALQAQRNAAQDDAARMKAAYDGVVRENEVLKAENAELLKRVEHGQQSGGSEDGPSGQGQKPGPDDLKPSSP